MVEVAFHKAAPVYNVYISECDNREIFGVYLNHDNDRSECFNTLTIGRNKCLNIWVNVFNQSSIFIHKTKMLFSICCGIFSDFARLRVSYKCILEWFN